MYLWLTNGRVRANAHATRELSQRLYCVGIASVHQGILCSTLSKSLLCSVVAPMELIKTWPSK